MTLKYFLMNCDNKVVIDDDPTEEQTNQSYKKKQ